MGLEERSLIENRQEKLKILWKQFERKDSQERTKRELRHREIKCRVDRHRERKNTLIKVTATILLSSCKPGLPMRPILTLISLGSNNYISKRLQQFA
jgi:hypothetical protein